MMPNIISNTSKKYTVRQKAILKRLIDADLSVTKAALVLGHTGPNGSVHFLRENEDYFEKAILKHKEMKRQRVAS